MVKKYIQWVAPVSAIAYTHTRVERSTDGGSNYAEFTVLNDPSWTSNGIPIALSAAVDLIGDSGYYYRIRFYDSVNAVFSDYSTPMRGSDFRGYCTIDDVRNFTNVQSAEYSDTAIQMFIDTTTRRIDLKMGRTWQGVQTVVDSLIDGDGSDTLMLPHGDIGTISALAFDVSGDGQWTTIPVTDLYLYNEQGFCALKTSTATYKNFPKYRQSIKISYTWGNEDPTEDIRSLCLLMVANMMKLDNTRLASIEEIFGEQHRARFSIP